MAYYLQFDGVNDYVIATAPSIVTPTSSYSVEMDVLTSNTFQPDTKVFSRSNRGSSTVILAGYQSDRTFRFFIRESTILSLFTPLLANNVRYKIRLDVNTLTGFCELFLDDSLVDSGTTIDMVGVSLATERFIGAQTPTLGRALFDLYGISETIDGVLTNNYNPSATNGIGSILPDTVSGNDGTLVNFPTDDSQWVFYDAGGGGLVITSIAIASAESFGTPVLTAGAVTLSPETIASAEALGNPTISQGATFISPLSINTEEFVGNPIVTPQGVIITPVEIPTEALVGNPEVSVGLAFILPEEIATQEFVGEPDIDLILKQIFPDAIASLLSVGRPLVLGGDRIIIPIESRVTWNAVAKYLRELVFTGADNDVIMKWLRSEGFDDAYNDNWEQYLKSAGFLSGAMSDKYALWRRGINGVDPWILSDGTWDDSKIWQDLETWRDS